MIHNHWRHYYKHEHCYSFNTKTNNNCLQYSGHRIEYKGSALPFVIYDVMGMEDSMASKGMHSDDILNALKGHIREGYEVTVHVFLPATPLKYPI